MENTNLKSMKCGISMLKWSNIFGKIGFYCLWFFDNHKNLWQGHKTLMNACKILLLRVKRESSYIHLTGIHQKSVILIIVASWWLQSWNLKNLIPLYMFPKGLVEEPCTLTLIVCPYLHVSYWTWCKNMPILRVQVLPCLRVVFVYYPFGFPFSWPANCFSAEPWIDFLDKHLTVGWKVIFFIT